MSFVGPNVWGITQSNVLFKNAKKWERQKSSAMLALSLSHCLQTTSKELRHPKRKQAVKWHGILEHYTANRPPHWIHWQLKVVVVVGGGVDNCYFCGILTSHMQREGSGFSERQRGKRDGLVDDRTELWQGNWKGSPARGTVGERTACHHRGVSAKKQNGAKRRQRKKKKAASAVSLESRWKPGEL